MHVFRPGPDSVPARLRSRRASVAALLALAALASLSAPAAAQESCPIEDADYRRVVLVSQPAEPMKLAPAPDGRVFWIERRGAVKVWLPATQTWELAGTLSVYQDMDEGLHGVALDPDFARNGWIYFSYDPRTDNHPEGPGRWLARFTVAGNRLDMASEKRILHVKIDRALKQGCCHQGGGLAFDAAGNIHMAVGENADYSLEYANVNENNPHQNSLRSSGNTNDLRGKVLRVHPEPDGSYTVPAGNLFPKGMEKTRPEIYAMGFRNPFTLSVDRKTGWLWVGEVGLDATVPSPDKGAVGYDEINLFQKAGFGGYPFVNGPNDPLRDYDYATNQPKDWFDPDALRNTSRYNTGLVDLAAAGKPVPALVYWTVQKRYSTAFPDLGEGKTAGMVGPTYRYDAASAGPYRLPAALDGRTFFWDHEREWIRVLTTTAEGQVARIDKFMTTTPWRGIVDIQAGADGALYVAEYGHGYYKANPEAKISRIEYIGKPCGSVVSGLVAGAGAPAAGLPGARLALPGPDGLLAEVPAGAASLEVLALDGRRLWRAEGLRGGERVRVPGEALAGGGVVMVRFR